MIIVPVIITIIALMPICIFCYYHIQDRIGKEQYRERQNRNEELVNKYPDKLEIIDGELRAKMPIPAKTSSDA